MKNFEYIFKGWIGKQCEPELIYLLTKYGYVITELRKTKGKKSNWLEENWPPKKVNIIIKITED